MRGIDLTARGRSTAGRSIDRDRGRSDMNVALTGATGFVGSHILAELLAHGHDVTALVRDDTQSDAVVAQGATATVVDLYDRPAVPKVMKQADGAVHRASPGDATSA